MANDRMALRAFRHLVEEAFGLVFLPEKIGDLEGILERVRQELGLPSLAALFERLEPADPAHEVWQPLRQALTVGETYFFRDPGQLEVIRQQVLRPLASGVPRKIRMWSAGCSSGEEAYTLAMMASELFPAQLGWQVDVLGTDLDQAALDLAKAGVYREWSFRGLPSEVRNRWFQSLRGNWMVNPALKADVRFRAHNLLRDGFRDLSQGEPFDLILCRNVFIYFKPRTVRAVVQHFAEVLSPHGALLVGHSELGIEVPPGMMSEVFADSMVLRLRSEKERPLPPLQAGSVATLSPPLPVSRALPPPALPPVSPNPLAEAAKAMALGDHARALELARSAVSQAVGREEALRLSAMALANLGRVNEAEVMVEEALNRNPASHRLHYLKSLLDSELGRQDKSLQHLDKALALVPDYIPALVDRARLRQNKDAAKDVERAIVLLERLNPVDFIEGMERIQVSEVLSHCRHLKEQLQVDPITKRGR